MRDLIEKFSVMRDWCPTFVTLNGMSYESFLMYTSKIHSTY